MKKYLYLVLVIAVPMFLASCGGGSSSSDGDSDSDGGGGGSDIEEAIEATCDCYKEAGVETQADLGDLDAEAREEMTECLEKLAEDQKDKKPTKEEIKEAEEAMKNSDCAAIFGFGDDDGGDDGGNESSGEFSEEYDSEYFLIGYFDGWVDMSEDGVFAIQKEFSSSSVGRIDIIVQEAPDTDGILEEFVDAFIEQQEGQFGELIDLSQDADDFLGYDGIAIEFGVNASDIDMKLDQFCFYTNNAIYILSITRTVDGSDEIMEEIEPILRSLEVK